eukprot:jgi/Tetstr1/421060/TSEL_012105.t1
MEGYQSAAEQGAAAMADEAMAADSTGAAAASTAANMSARVAQTPLGMQADDILIDNDEDDPLLGLNPSAPPLSILSKAAAGCWGGTQRENNRAVWSFFVPHDTSLPPDESRKSNKNLDLDAKVKELLASYYGEAAFSAVSADLLKPCGEDWLATQVLDGEGEGEASRIQWEAVESMLEQYEEAAPADEEAGD